MSDSSSDTQEQYWNLVEEFIELANKRTEECDLGAVSQALMYAAARYSAFYLASASESRKDLKEDKDDAIDRFSREFKRLFADSTEDYIENYKIYMRTEEE
ncbi:DUF3144 domain-containing protein [Saccharophagus degradans]|uniref:DUF3144 domain-containing protein n=1 Tax=Saccharophagus degradans TaxID=86304 RepID=UPI001C08E722|nr:DUF3144 domain-containing protein [Saccharophagus degradans]MBU2985258.1 DUF3144 domain-containing protein [Saccharophagus degradans]